MRVLIATGIFEPEAGGPATYAPQLASKLVEQGLEVTVVTYSAHTHEERDTAYPFTLVRVVRSTSKFLNRRAYYKTVRKLLDDGYDLVYMLDWFAAGMPAAAAARVKRVPYVVRVGGDYLWEQRYLEKGKTPLSLKDFYAQRVHRNYSILFALIGWVLRHAAHVVFNSDEQQKLYERHYGLTRTSVIYNPVPAPRQSDSKQRAKEFVFWGRFIVMKNLTTLVRAFAQAKIAGYTLTLIGDGPRKEEIRKLIIELGLAESVSVLHAMPRAAVWERVKDARAFILPSWTDISPNQVAEALALGLPALVTKENYLSIASQFPETIDPASVDDIAQKMKKLTDDAYYAEYLRKWNAISFSQTWEHVAKQHTDLFQEIV